MGSNHGRGSDSYLHTVCTGCGAAHSFIQWVPRASSSVIMRSEFEAGQSIHLSAEVNLWTCTSAPPICVHDARVNSFTFSRRLPETAVFYRVFPGTLTSLVSCPSVLWWSLNCLMSLLLRCDKGTGGSKDWPGFSYHRGWDFSPQLPNRVRLNWSSVTQWVTAVCCGGKEADACSWTLTSIFCMLMS